MRLGYDYSSVTAANWMVRKSTTGASGTFAAVDSLNGVNNSTDTCYGIAISSSGEIYTCGQESYSSAWTSFTIRKSTTGASGSFTTIDSHRFAATTTNTGQAIAISPIDGDIYVAGYEGSSKWCVRKSTTGASASFITVDSGDINAGQTRHSICYSNISSRWSCLRRGYGSCCREQLLAPQKIYCRSIWNLFYC